jgi:hypothetical protein
MSYHKKTWERYKLTYIGLHVNFLVFLLTFRPNLKFLDWVSKKPSNIKFHDVPYAMILTENQLFAGQKTVTCFYWQITSRPLAEVYLTRGSWALFPSGDRELTVRQTSGTLLHCRWKFDVWRVGVRGHTVTPYNSQYAVPCKDLAVQTGGAEQPLLCGPSLVLAAVDSLSHSRSDTKSAAVFHRTHLLASAYSAAHTNTRVTTILFSNIGGRRNTRAGMSVYVWRVQRVASAPPRVPGCYKGNVAPDGVGESGGAAPLIFGLSTWPLCAR